MKTLVKLLIAIASLLIVASTAYAMEDCSTAEGRERRICEIKALKENPPTILDDACNLWTRMQIVDSALVDWRRYSLSEEGLGITEAEATRLQHEAADQFAAYAIGILQMSRETRRYKRCDYGKAEFSWANGYEIAEHITKSKGYVSKAVLRSVLMVDADRHLQELRTAMAEQRISVDEAMPCIVSILDGVNRYNIVLTIAQWGPEDNAAVDRFRGGDHVCLEETSIYLRSAR